MKFAMIKEPVSSFKTQVSIEELKELQRLADLGRLSATLLHEISNPLTSALIHLDHYSDKSSAAIRQARRSIKLLKSYVEAARQQVRRESTLTDFRIRPQVNQVKRVVAPIAKRSDVQLIIDHVPDCRLYGDPVKFQQILANLTVNAIEAYGTVANVLIKPVKVTLTSTEHQLIIEVTDWGQGINSLQIHRLFEPFYTTKSQAGHGLGIGLAIVKQYVADEFGGTIRISSSRRKGTTFKVIMPAFYRPVSR